MTFAIPPGPSNWNPLSAGAGGPGSPAALVAPGVLPSAFVAQPNYTEQLNGDLLTSATVTSTNPQTVVYKINPKAVWSDGQPITAGDFIYNWQAQSGKAQFRDVGGAPYTPASTAGYSQIANVTQTGPDPESATVTFATPDPDWQTLFRDLVPAHVASTVGFNAGFVDPAAALVSGGPFMVASAVPGHSVTLVRNSRYYGGTPAGLSSVTFDFVGSPSQVATGLGAKELNGAWVPASTDAANTLKSVSGTKLTAYSSAHWDDLVFNQTNRWLSDPKLRQAIMLSVDVSKLISGAVGSYDSTATPLGNRAFMPSSTSYKNDTTGPEAGAGSGSQPPGPNPPSAPGTTAKPGAPPNKPGAPPNKPGGPKKPGGPQKPASAPSTAPKADSGSGASASDAKYGSGALSAAKSILDQSGYSAASGVLVKNGQAISLRLAVPPGQIYEAEATNISASLSSLGITVTTVPLPAHPGLASPGYDLAIVPRTASPDLGAIGADYGNPANVGTDNYAGVDDPAVDGLLGQGLNAPSGPDRDAIYNRIDATLWSEAATLPLLQEPTLMVVGNDYNNVNAGPSSPTYNIADWGVPAST